MDPKHLIDFKKYLIVGQPCTARAFLDGGRGERVIYNLDKNTSKVNFIFALCVLVNRSDSTILFYHMLQKSRFFFQKVIIHVESKSCYTNKTLTGEWLKISEEKIALVKTFHQFKKKIQECEFVQR